MTKKTKPNNPIKNMTQTKNPMKIELKHSLNIRNKKKNKYITHYLKKGFL